jgi:ABC-type polysaccharide/polyol phosphate export permease
MSTTQSYDSSLRRLKALEELREIFCNRFLIFQLVRRDIVARYKRSIIGIAWTVLNPLGTMIILTIVFSKAFGTGRAYAAYILSGLVVWLFFSQSTNGAARNLVWGEDLIKRIYLPRTAFAVAAVSVGLVNMVFSLAPLLLVMLVTGVPWHWTLLLLPVPIFFLYLFTLGVALAVSTLVVYFSDVAEIYSVVLLAWMYLSPILYPEEYLTNLPGVGFWIANLNPIYHLLKLFRGVVLEGVVPDIQLLVISGSIAIIAAIAGWLIFTSRADELAYRI